MVRSIYRRSLVFIPALVMILVIFAQQVNANKVIYVEREVTFDQGSARAMLDMVNDLRTGDDAWYWNSDNTTKTDLSGTLGTLTYDYNLEAIAMQRAYELSVVFAHQCPDGSGITSISVNGTTTCGENIYCCSPSGTQDTTQKAFNSWLEESANYAGQGHRRSMLDSSYNAIGIGHVVIDGYHYWVQEFGYNVSSNNTYTAPEQGTYTKGINYDTECTFYGGKTTHLMAFLDSGGLGAYYPTLYGQTKDLPGVNLWYTVDKERTSSYPGSAYSYVTRPLYGAPAPESEYTVTWTSSDESIVTTDGSTYTVVGVGEATLTATIVDGSQTLTCNAYIKGNKVDLYSDNITVEFDQDSYTYTGSEIRPGFTVRNGDLVLTEGVDYTVDYNGCTYPSSSAYITLTAVDGSNYTGSRWAEFTISKAEMADAQITLSATSMAYTGSARKPTVSVYYNGNKLSSYYDYDVSFSDNINAGTVTVTVTGKNNFQGTAAATYTITPQALTSGSITVSGLSTAAYTGSEIVPDITVKKGSVTLTEGTDYDITVSDNILPGTATVTIDFKGNYSGQVVKTFNINKVNVSTLTYSDVEDQEYDGTAHRPAVDVFFGNRKLTEGTDYILTYKNGKDIGPASITVSGCGDCFTGSYVINYSILAGNISDATIDLIADQEYTGSAITPLPVVRYKGQILSNGTDYTLSYAGNTDVGTASVTITGTGNFEGEIPASFIITRRQLNSSNSSISAIPDQTYTGGAITPAVTVRYGTKVLTSSDYDAVITDNINKGDATVTVTFKGNYEGTITGSFKIVPKLVSGLTISSIPDQTYNGSAKTPALSVYDGNKLLSAGTDYTVSYSSNTNAGTATVTITGKGNYEGTTTTTFKINALALSSSNSSVDAIPDQGYSGNSIVPGITVRYGNKLLTSSDYDVAITDNINAGTATVTVTFKGNYSGRITANFTIIPKQVSGLTISSIPDQIYSGSAKTPALSVYDGNKLLAAGTNYTVSYSANTDAGTATVMITGKGNYEGAATTTFKINALTLNSSNSSVESIPSQQYTGYAVEPDILVRYGNKTLSSSDYDVAFTDNIDAGTATVTVTFKGNYSGQITTGFIIALKSIDDVTISEIPDQIYDGSEKTPEITVYDGDTILTEGTDYTVSYSSNVEAGEATVTVDFIGDYAGQLTCSFRIIKPVVSGWKHNSKGWWYVDEDGSYPVSEWKKIGNVWYYFNDSGYMVTGWQKISGSWYYFASSGAMQTGWQKIGGKYYYFASGGAMKTGWIRLSGKWYYLESSGAMVTGWKKISNKWYYFQSSGAMQTADLVYKGKTYYFNSDGSCKNP